MKREFLKAFEGLTDEAITQIMTENGKDIEKAKGEFETLKQELEGSKQTIAEMKGEMDTLKESGASAKDWEDKYNSLSKKLEEIENAKREAEKTENISKRYLAAAVDNNGNPLEWTHEAIKNDYLKKFEAAVSDKSNEGKSDAEIFKALTKDDGSAFKTVSGVQTLPGAKSFSGEGMTDAQINSIMGIK